MAFSHSRYANASRSTFNDVRRDQINNSNISIGHQTIHINISQLDSGQTLHHVLCNLSDEISLSSGSKNLSQNMGVSLKFSGASSALDDAAGLIVKIVQSLMDPESSSHHRDLKLELELLQQTLTLAGLAIQTYEYTPLGRNMTNIINHEVDHCRVILQELLGIINCYRRSLTSTSIHYLWRQVLWRGSEVEELTSLQMKLVARQKSLGACLMALNSVSWEELGNGLRAGRVPLKTFHALLRQGPSLLRHIQIDKVLVVDHLGRTIPVPTIFCSTWKEFDYVIYGYCKDSLGVDYIKRGDYQMIRAEDCQIISPSEFASSVESGMVLEMSIVLRKRATFEDNEEMCPRCDYVNLNVTSNSGWIECRKCSGQFQVAKEKDIKHAEMGGLGDSQALGGRQGDENSDQEVISPASLPKERSTRLTIVNDNSAPEDNSEQFFRRIQVVYWNDIREPLERIYAKFGSLDNAEKTFTSMLRKHEIDLDSDKKSEVNFSLGIIYKEQGKYDQSLACFDRILRNPPNPLTHGDVWFQIGDVYEEQQDYINAKDAYERVVADNHSHAKALQRLGWLHLSSSQNPNVAKAYLTKSLEADSRIAHTWYLLGRAYCAVQQFNKAYEAYQQAVYRDSRNPTFWCSIGILYFQINQFRDALDAYARTIRIDPNISEVWYNFGILYEACNQISDAINAYARASELDPENPVISQRLYLLTTMQATEGQLEPRHPRDIHPTGHSAAISGKPMLPQTVPSSRR